MQQLSDGNCSNSIIERQRKRFDGVLYNRVN